jgi:nucleoside-triphosphatase THEP1
MKEGSRLALVTGEVGVGKTTVVGRVVELVRARGCVCAGLWAPARVVGGQKVGIEAVDLRSGKCRLLARTATQGAGEQALVQKKHHIFESVLRPISDSKCEVNNGQVQVGPYTFDAAVLAWANQVLADAIATRPDLLVVDEIGPLELERGRGLAPVLSPLAAGRVPRALVVVRAWLLDALRARLPGVPTAIFAVSPKTREAIPKQVVNWLH